MTSIETHIEGIAFLGEEFIPENVEITINNQFISDIIPSHKKATQYILPGFFNAHTHIGDTVALDTPATLPLTELVSPPNGLKHKILNNTPASELIAGMKNSIAFMKSRGTLGFSDFREGGITGIEQIISILDPEILPVILGREGGELHPFSAGLGLSSAHGTREELKCSQRMKESRKLIAVHAGENGTKDIEPAFSLHPDMIIHATHFRKQDIQQAADEDIAITICPRSNWTLHVSNTCSSPPVHALLSENVRVYLGTDNVMFVPPDMFAECAFLMNVYDISAENALKMATSGFALANTPTGISIGNPANLTILDGSHLLNWSKYPLRTALLRLGSSAVKYVISANQSLMK